ncbi:MAG: hypothetical protein L0206_14995 [Actinobacteria bacterium]|nr:hypothetical protein [Actinomycetota bacterium]
MLLPDLIVTLLVAVLLTVVFAAALGQGRRPTADRGIGNLIVFFLLIWLATWAIGAWIAPVGPTVYGAPVLTFLFVGILLTLVIAAMTAPRGPRDRREPPDEVAIDLTPQGAAQAGEAGGMRPPLAGALVTALGVVFWVVLAVCVVALIAAYVR